MGKKSKSQSKSDNQAPNTGGALPFLAESAALDPTLSTLFASSVRVAVMLV